MPPGSASSYLGDNGLYDFKNLRQELPSLLQFHLAVDIWFFALLINMKFILTGCTGFIGSEVLTQCLRNPTITSIIALSRRSLPDSVSNDPKLKVLIMKDFNVYPEPVLKELEGADACIW